MKWFSETWDQKRNRLSKWHKYYAWFPVRTGPEKATKVWLEPVGRKGDWDSGYGDGWWNWEYCEIQNLEFEILKEQKESAKV